MKDLASIQIDYTYDDKFLTYAGTQTAQAFSGANVNEGRFVWNGNVSALPADGVLFTVTFNVAEDATGVAEFKFTYTELMDSEYIESMDGIYYVTTNGKVDLTPPPVVPATLKFDAVKDGDVVTL